MEIFLQPTFENNSEKIISDIEKTPKLGPSAESRVPNFLILIGLMLVGRGCLVLGKGALEKTSVSLSKVK